MNKKSFSLIEVIVAVSILSIVITSTLQIRQNNLNLLDDYKIINKQNEYISLANIYESKDNNLENTNTNIYLDKIIDFTDDDIRKELKEQKVYIKSEINDNIYFSTDDLTLNIDIIKTNYKIDDKINKNYFTFKLN